LARNLGVVSLRITSISGPWWNRRTKAVWAISATSQTRIIRRHVLYAHLKSLVAAGKIAAMQHVGGEFRLLATASEPIASINSQRSDRAS
jgi:hypothetical protein